MKRDEANSRIGGEDRFGSVAVMNVPIEDQNALQATLLERVESSYGDIIEEAEAHSSVGFGVMPRRAVK